MEKTITTANRADHRKLNSETYIIHTVTHIKSVKLLLVRVNLQNLVRVNLQNLVRVNLQNLVRVNLQNLVRVK